MITEEELKLSNLSYTNKDFASIYPELLDLAKKISPRWDPSQTNESDPGLVLLKLLAFIGDKTNYNSDKNVLECFLPSATQENSVRTLCETNGYFPKYYQSAETLVSFRYDGTKLGDGKYFRFPAFTTVVSDTDEEVSYSLLSPITVDKRKRVYSALAIQGTFNTLTVGGKEKIQLSDLDDNYRVYLPDGMIAQNGVFVFSEGEIISTASSWERVDNLNLVDPSDEEGKFAYKVGYDSEQGLPYVEFPDNIADLIEDGVIIKYCSTAGASGNISAGTLAKLVSPMQVDVFDSSASKTDTIDFSASEDSSESSDYGTLIIKNVSSTTSGRDPEGIVDAYNNFKKTVGTFDTLVTCNDYANAIYNLTDDETGSPYVSNIVVTDRRTDVNFGNSIVTFSELGQTVTRLSDAASAITPFELCMYPLQPISEYYTSDSYARSFKPLSDTLMIEQDIEGLKTISHEYKDVSSADIWAIKNYYDLNAVITTSSKVNDFEQAEIKSAVATALMEAFNGRKVDYGFEIPFDSILEVIQNADSRINNVSLDDPVVHAAVMDAAGREASLFEKTGNIRANYVNVIAKNALAGRVSLFNYDEDFDYDFGMSNISGQSGYKAKGIYKMETLATIMAADSDNLPGYASDNGYTLRDNEVVQFIAPNYSARITYPAYTNFRYETTLRGGRPCTVSSTTYAAPVSDFAATQASSSNYSWYYKRVKNTTISPAIGELVDSAGNLYEKADSSSNVSGVTLYKMNAFGEVSVGIRANTLHVMQSSETLCINYTDSGSVEHNIIYTHDKITDNGSVIYSGEVVVKSNFDILPVVSYKVLGRSVIEKGGKSFYTLSTNETINEMRKVRREITDDQLYCYWSVSSVDNALFTANERQSADDNGFILYERLLGDNEYFAYTDSSKTELVILQSGTVLQYRTSTELVADDWKCDKELISELTKNGLSIFEEFNWQVKSFSQNHLIIQDMQILSLTSNDAFKLTGYSGDITSDWKSVGKSATIEYKLSGESSFEKLAANTDDSCAWKVRSRLDLNCGPKTKQAIKRNQSVKLYCNADAVESADKSSLLPQAGAGTTVQINGADSGVFVMTNIDYNNVVGGTIDTITTNISSEGTTYSLDLNALYFSYSNPTYTRSNGAKIELERHSGYISVPVNDIKGNVNLPILENDGSTLLMCYLDCSSAFEVSIATAKGTVRRYNSGDIPSAFVNLKSENGENVMAVLEIQGSDVLTLSKASGDDASATLTLGGLSLVKSRTSGTDTLMLNEAFGLTSAEETALLNKIRELDSANIFYYNVPSDSAQMMDVADMTKSTALWDKNNLFNRVTIGEIDFSKNHFTISIARSSRK